MKGKGWAASQSSSLNKSSTPSTWWIAGREPARRERPAHLQTAKAAIAEGTEPMTTWRAPGFFLMLQGGVPLW